MRVTTWITTKGDAGLHSVPKSGGWLNVLLRKDSIAFTTLGLSSWFGIDWEHFYCWEVFPPISMYSRRFVEAMAWPSFGTSTVFELLRNFSSMAEHLEDDLCVVGCWIDVVWKQKCLSEVPQTPRESTSCISALWELFVEFGLLLQQCGFLSGIMMSMDTDDAECEFTLKIGHLFTEKILLYWWM